MQSGNCWGVFKHNYGTKAALTHFEPCRDHSARGTGNSGTTMADRSGLRLLGFIFATVTLAVMLTTGLVVKGYADGAYSLEATPAANGSASCGDEPWSAFVNQTPLGAPSGYCHSQRSRLIARFLVAGFF